MSARRRVKAELPPLPIPQVEGQLPLFPVDGAGWWTQRPEWAPRPAGEVDEAGGDQGPWGGGEGE